MTNPNPDTVLTAVADRRPDSADALRVSRWMLGVLGAFHSPAYRIDAVLEGLDNLGLGAPDKTRMPTTHYVTQRAAPLGAVDATVVASAFYGFSPTAISRCLSGAWDATSPAAVIDTVLHGVSQFYAPLFTHTADAVGQALSILKPVAEAHETVGRPLAAAWATVAWTGDVFTDFWLATTRIRESRGDAHIACLVSEHIGPTACHFLAKGDNDAVRANLMTFRGWTNDELDAGATQLKAVGLLDAAGNRTDDLVALHSRLESATDRASADAWAGAGPANVSAAADALMVLLEAVLIADVIPAPAYARLMPS